MCLCKTPSSPEVPFSTRVYKMGTGEIMLGGNPAMDLHPIQGGVEILLVTSYYRNWDKLWPDGPLDLTQTLPYLVKM